MTTTSRSIGETLCALSRIAERPGWRVTTWSCGVADVVAVIEKDGVVLEFRAHHADCSETVYLRRPVHPEVALYPYRAPTIADVLEGIDIACVEETCFPALADHLPAVKRYLSDPAIFHRHVLLQAERVHATYVSLGGNPAFADLRDSMLSRHRWLKNGVPPIDALLIGVSSAGGGRGRRQWAVVLLAVVVGIMSAGLLRGDG